MARSTYISENVTGDQLDFIKILSDLEIDYFKLTGIKSKLGDRFDNINEIVENLEHKGVLTRIERGVYANYNFNDPFVFGTLIARKSAIAYWSALNTHGLTDRFPNTVFVQTTQRKKSKRILGVYYRFVTILPRKRTGISNHGYGNYRYPVTDVEKTIVDCFDLPQYAGGFDTLIAAYSEANLDADKMIEYATAVDNISAIKRMGFLAQLFNKIELEPFIRYASDRVNKKYSLIDAGGAEEGKFVSDWRLRLNVSRKDLLQIANEPY